jgi:pyrimidine operon attenuation protein/uracil phosphoribosyltransferase
MEKMKIFLITEVLNSGAQVRANLNDFEMFGLVKIEIK